MSRVLFALTLAAAFASAGLLAPALQDKVAPVNVGPGSQTYDRTFWHEMTPDTNRHNDTVEASTTTWGHDVSVAGMNVGGRVRANTPVIPRINLASSDYTESDFEAWCVVDSSGTVVYEDSTEIDSVPAGGSRSFAFPSAWNVGPVGAAYTATMYHNCSPDQNRSNDTMSLAATAIGQVRVLMCYADLETPDSLVAGLVAMGDSVTLRNVINNTPSLNELQAYNAVGAMSNYAYQDPTGFGNVLADYVDAGGGVVIGMFSFYDTPGWRMDGRIMTGAYATISVGRGAGGTQLGWYNSAHPIMSGVTAVGEIYTVHSTFVGESVAAWQNGSAYVGVSSNQKVVGLNQYPGDHEDPERGDWVLVWHNSFMYVAGSASGVHQFDPFAPGLSFSLTATPNPALGPRAEVNYIVPDGSRVSLNVFDLNGRLVRTLVSGNAEPGVNRVLWNLTNDAGKRVSSGVYFCKLVAGGKTQSRKLVVR